jgi:hypothetical protein
MARLMHTLIRARWWRGERARLTLPMPKGRGFLGCSPRTRHAHPQVKRCDRLTRALGTWLSPPLHRRPFPQALRYCRQSTTRRARAPFIPRTEVRGLLTEKDNWCSYLAVYRAMSPHCIPKHALQSGGESERRQERRLDASRRRASARAASAAACAAAQSAASPRPARHC